MSVVFAHPGIALATLGLIGIPVLIHLFNRRRYREEPWAAMTFLLAAQRRNRRRMRIEQWLLLALRMLVVAAVGLAVARPALSTSALARAAAEPRFDRVLILDDTFSMQGRRADGRTAFEAARDLARKLVDSFGPSDGVAVVTLAGKAQALIDRPTFDRETVHRVLDGATPTADVADLDAAFTLARDALDRAQAPPDCRAAYILTDLARTTWLAPGGESRQRDAVADAVAALGGPASFYVVNVGGALRGNVAVAELRVHSSWIARDLPVTVEARIAAFGMPLPERASVTLLVDGVPQPSRPLATQPGQPEARLDAQVRFERPGSHVLTCRVASVEDALPADDQRSILVQVAENLPLLLVSGAAGASPADDDAFYLATVLTPHGAGPPPADAGLPFAARVIPESGFDDAVLDEVRAVVLLNVRRLSELAWQRLARFVRQGGGLVVALGDRVDLEHYNESVGPLAAGGDSAALLPAALEQAVALGDADPRPRLRGEDWAHPILRDLAGHVGGGLHSAGFDAFVRVPAAGAPGRTAGARCVLSYDNGEAALLEHRFGRGRVLLWTSALHTRWTNLPAKPDFVPLAMNLLAYAAAEDALADNLRVGDAYVARLAPAERRSELAIVRPNGVHEAAAPVESAGEEGPVLRFTGADAPGVYALEGGSRRRVFAVATDPAESDLDPAGYAALRQRLGQDFVFVDDPDDLLRRPGVAPRVELSATLFGALFVLVLAETVVAFWFGHH